MQSNSEKLGQIIERVITVPLEGATMGPNELLDLLRRSVSSVRENDPEIAECILHDLRFKFQRDGIIVTAEFRK